MAEHDSHYIKLGSEQYNFRDDTKLSASNPTGSGALSMNRKVNTTVGTKSTTLGENNTASNDNTLASGYLTTASGSEAVAIGILTTASGDGSVAEGSNTIASGLLSHAEGFYTKASSDYQHVSGKYNVEDANDTYAEIIGNGSSENVRSNARTLDWNGNETIAGDLYFNGGVDPLSTQLSAKADASDMPSTSGYKDDFSDVSLANSTSWSTLASFNLTKGVWIVEVAAEFQNNSSGFRSIGLYIGTSTPSSPTGIRYINNARAADGAVTNVTLTPIVDINSDRSIYILGRQNSGTTLTTKPRASWVKIMPR